MHSAPICIHHLALRTSDLARLTDFYERAVGLAPAVEKPNGSRWFALGTAWLMIEQRAVGEPALAPDSMEFLAFTTTPQGKTEALERLAECGVTLEAQTAFTIYFRDPDGRRIGLSHYQEDTSP